MNETSLQRTADDQRVALITGANRGLGRATALRLAAKGFETWLGVRDTDSAKAVAEDIRRVGGKVEILQVDMTNADSIAHAARTLSESRDRLDVLVNNAAVMRDGAWFGNSVTTIEPAALRETFETNLFGLVALTQAVWPLLQRPGHANVVNVSSILGSNTLHADPDSLIAPVKAFAYDASKTALNSYTIHLALAGRPLGIQVNSAHPGWVRTDMGTDEAPMSINEGIQTIVELALLPPDSFTGRFVHNREALPW